MVNAPAPVFRQAFASTEQVFFRSFFAIATDANARLELDESAATIMVNHCSASFVASICSAVRDSACFYNCLQLHKQKSTGCRFPKKLEVHATWDYIASVRCGEKG